MEEETSIKDKIARNISCLRKREKMTQADLANKLNYSDKAISKWERGESLPDAEMLYQIAQLFHVSVEYLFQDHDYPGLSNAELRDLEKREKRTKIILALTIFAVIVTLLGIVFASITEILNINDAVKAYLFIIPGIPAIFLIINSINGQRKYNLLLESLILWSTSISIYTFFNNPVLLVIFAAAAVIQATLIFFPKISAFYRKRYVTSKPDEAKDKTKK